MRTRRALLRTLCSAALLLIPALTACPDDETTAPDTTNPLVATWHITSFQAMGGDFIQQGMTFTFTFNEQGGCSLSVTGDLIGACDVGTSCTTTGTWSSTSTTFTLDPGTEDEVVFNYTINGNTMTWTGSINGNAATVVLSKG